VRKIILLALCPLQLVSNLVQVLVVELVQGCVYWLYATHEFYGYVLVPTVVVYTTT
jgi:hypothetical protein